MVVAPITPIALVHSLADCIRSIVKNYRYPESDGEHEYRVPKVWAQNLPEKRHEEQRDQADPPFVLVALGGGTMGAIGASECNIGILVAAYDEGILIDGLGKRSTLRSGWELSAELTWRIVVELAQLKSLGAFKLQYPFAWTLPEQENPSPHWFGIIDTRWANPAAEPNYDLGNMDLYGHAPIDLERM